MSDADHAFTLRRDAEEPLFLETRRRPPPASRNLDRAIAAPAGSPGPSMPPLYLDRPGLPAPGRSGRRRPLALAAALTVVASLLGAALFVTPAPEPSPAPISAPEPPQPLARTETPAAPPATILPIQKAEPTQKARRPQPPPERRPRAEATARARTASRTAPLDLDALEHSLQ